MLRGSAARLPMVTFGSWRNSWSPSFKCPSLSHHPLARRACPPRATCHLGPPTHAQVGAAGGRQHQRAASAALRAPARPCPPTNPPTLLLCRRLTRHLPPPPQKKPNPPTHRSALLVVGSINASRSLHSALLAKVVRLPMSFFDSQPTGGIERAFERCGCGFECGRAYSSQCRSGMPRGTALLRWAVLVVRRVRHCLPRCCAAPASLLGRQPTGLSTLHPCESTGGIWLPSCQ